VRDEDGLTDATASPLGAAMRSGNGPYRESRLTDVEEGGHEDERVRRKGASWL
jgi:hypothetical protein